MDTLWSVEGELAGVAFAGVCEAASAVEAIQKYLAKERLEDLNKITVERMPAIDNVVGLMPDVDRQD